MDGIRQELLTVVIYSLYVEGFTENACWTPNISR